MKKVALLASTILFFGAAPAFAQDAASPAANFSGPRVEGRIGYDIATSELSVDDGVDAFDEDGDEDGLILGGEIGFDVPAGSNFVFGGYLGADHSSLGECSEFLGQDQLCFTTGLNLTVGARAGAVVGENALFYAKGGYSRSNVGITYEDFEDLIEDIEEDDHLDGFHIGGGAELGLGNKAYLKLDYTYTFYGDVEIDDEDVEIASSLNRHQVMFGLGFRF